MTTPATEPPEGLEFPFGLIGFTLVLGEEGSDAEVRFTYPQSIDPNAEYWKYDGDRWFALPADRVSIEGNSVTIILTDGGVGDLTGTRNSRIVDPGGLAVRSDEDEFVEPPIPVPVNNPWLLLLLALLTFGLAAPRLRRQTG